MGRGPLIPGESRMTIQAPFRRLRTASSSADDSGSRIACPRTGPSVPGDQFGVENWMSFCQGSHRRRSFGASLVGRRSAFPSPGARNSLRFSASENQALTGPTLGRSVQRRLYHSAGAGPMNILADALPPRRKRTSNSPNFSSRTFEQPHSISLFITKDWARSSSGVPVVRGPMFLVKCRSRETTWL